MASLKVLDDIQDLETRKANKSEIPTSLPANGGNADTVDGLHATQFVNKIFLTKEIVNDANYKTAYVGDYEAGGANTIEGLPVGWYHIIYSPHRNPNGHGAQIFVEFSGGKSYVRSAGAMTWTPFQQFYTSTFKPTAADVGLGNVNNWGATSAVNDSSSSKYATASAVKQAYDRAEQAFQSASSGKTAIANAITGKGVSASGNDSFDALASKITQITSIGTLVPKTGSSTQDCKIGGLYTSNVGKLPYSHDGLFFCLTTPTSASWRLSCDKDIYYSCVGSSGGVISNWRLANPSDNLGGNSGTTYLWIFNPNGATITLRRYDGVANTTYTSRLTIF